MFDFDDFDNLLASKFFAIDVFGNKVTEGSLVLYITGSNSSPDFFRVKKMYKKDDTCYALSEKGKIYVLENNAYSRKFLRIDDNFIREISDKFNNFSTEPECGKIVDFEEQFTYYIPLFFSFGYKYSPSRYAITKRGIMQVRVKLPKFAVVNNFKIKVKDQEEEAFEYNGESFLSDSGYSSDQAALNFELQPQIVNILKNNFEDFDRVYQISLRPVNVHCFENFGQKFNRMCLESSYRMSLQDKVRENTFFSSEFTEFWLLSEEDKLFPQKEDQDFVCFFAETEDEVKRALAKEKCGKGNLCKNIAQKVMFYSYLDSTGGQDKFSYDTLAEDKSFEDINIQVFPAFFTDNSKQDLSTVTNPISKKLQDFINLKYKEAHQSSSCDEVFDVKLFSKFLKKNICAM